MGPPPRLTLPRQPWAPEVVPPALSPFCQVPQLSWCPPSPILGAHSAASLGLVSLHDVENLLAFDICSGLLFPALCVWGWTEDDKPLPGRPSSPLPLDKFSIKGPQRKAAELRPTLPPTGSSCTKAADGLALGRHLGKPESRTRPEPLAGTAPGRKLPRDVLMTAGGENPER